LLGFAAVNTGNNLIYLMDASLLGFMAVSGLIGRYNLAGLELELSMPDDLFAGVETLVSVRLYNRKRFPTFLLAVEIGDASVLFPLLPGRHSARKPLPFVLLNRGQQLLPPGTFRSCFPVNFFVRSFSAPEAGTATVFPAPRPCRQFIPDAQGVQSGRHVATKRGGDGDIERISKYSGQEPLKMIHWKLTARQGELLVKELADSAGEPLILDLAKLPGKDIEQQLSCATWLIRHALRNNRPVGLQLPERMIPPSTGRRHRLQLLTELALYGSDQAET
jgi:uncharacterized protein (DUF58 family)